jgi:hypothetical protein
MIDEPTSQPLFPPPADAILEYAAYGWAKANGHLAPTGRPRLLERKIWVPLFNALAQSDAGLLKLKAYAEDGLKAWNVAPSIAACLDAAFATKGFDSLLQSELQHLADTADVSRGPVILHDLPTPEPPTTAPSQTDTPQAERPSIKSSWQPGQSKGPTPRL